MRKYIEKLVPDYLACVKITGKSPLRSEGPVLYLHGTAIGVIHSLSSRLYLTYKRFSRTSTSPQAEIAYFAKRAGFLKTRYRTTGSQKK
mgnify:CR=1 FL=1|jgi:hypothetical protein